MVIADYWPDIAGRHARFYWSVRDRQLPRSPMTIREVMDRVAERSGRGRGHGCSTLRNGEILKQVIDACQSSAVAVLADCAGLV